MIWAAAALAIYNSNILLIKANPAILQNPEELMLIRKKLDVDELHVSDKTGKLIASLVHDSYHGKDNYLGFNLAKEIQSRVFMQAVTDPEFELVQEPMPNGAEGKLFQYTGVARLDEPGVVQIGYSPERIKKARQLANIRHIESATHIGINGKLTITTNFQYPKDYQKAYNTREGLCHAAVSGKYLLTVMLPWKDVHSKDRTFIITLFVGNIVVFALIFALIANLLQKVVIKEISDVTHSLDEFSKGNFDKEIEAKGSSEMHALAESINKTVSALKKRNIQSRAQTDAEISAMLKCSLKPVDIPKCPNYKFTAEIFTENEISGHLCDVFPTGKDSIAMFFADVAEKGICQGLHMMRAKNTLRKALIKNTPEKALSIVNEELFSGSEQKIPLKVFLGILNFRSGVLQTFNAGYVDPINKPNSGSAGFIKGPFSPALGVAADSTFIQLPLQLEKGNKIYFYSSDILDIENARGDKYGRDRLLDIISASDDDAAGIIESIRQDVKKFTKRPTDKADIAIAILEYAPETEE